MEIPNTIQTKKRWDYLDAAKGLGMFAIIWGHIHLGFSTQYVFSFHVPLFFILSGMIFSPEKYTNFKTFFLRKTKTLLLPYVICSVVTWAIWAAYVTITHQQVDSLWMPLLETIIAQGGQDYLIHNAPLWFITCLIVTEIVYYWICKLPDILNFISCLTLAATSYILVNYATFFDFTTLPWNSEVMMMSLIFFSIGHLIVKHFGHSTIVQFIEAHWILSLFEAILMLVALSVVVKINGFTSIAHAHLNNPFLYYSGAFMGSFAFIILSILLSKTIMNIRIWRSILWFGKNSLYALLIHNPIKGFLLAAATIIMKIDSGILRSNFLFSIAIWTITIAITVLIMIPIVRRKQEIKNEAS